MHYLECPHCGSENEIDTEDWPENACDDKGHECIDCEQTFKFGWYAEIELR